MATDAYGETLEIGTVVVQDRRKMGHMIREVIDIDEDEHPNQVRLGQGRGCGLGIRPTWVETRKLFKYFNQEIFNVQKPKG
ncbi:hypothetical protein VPHD148_0146 [Vibrio phage D148]